MFKRFNLIFCVTHTDITQLRIYFQKVSFDSCQEQDIYLFSETSRTTVIGLFIQWASVSLTLGVKHLRREARHVLVMQRLRMCGITRLFIHTPSWPSQEQGCNADLNDGSLPVESPTVPRHTREC
jgi:hypothetical protein